MRVFKKIHMNNKIKSLAIIPARGGSKRIPNKNLVKINNESLVDISMRVALESNLFDKVVLSSDDLNILNESIKFSEKITALKRSSENSSDSASSIEAVLEVVRQLNENYDYICLLQPTSPFRTAVHLKEAFECFTKSNADSLVSVKKVETNPFHIVAKEGKEVKPLMTENLFNFRTQMTPELFCLNGCIYFAKYSYFAENKTFLGKNCELYLMGSIESLDIDTPEDYQLALEISNRVK